MNAQTKEIILERLTFGLAHRLSSNIMDNMEVNCYLDRFADHIVFQIKNYFWGEKSPELIIEYPLNWWQAFKQRWFPQWALKRWPVILKVHHLNVLTIYPDLKISLPKEQHIFKIMNWEDKAEAAHE